MQRESGDIFLASPPLPQEFKKKGVIKRKITIFINFKDIVGFYCEFNEIYTTYLQKLTKI